MNGALCTHSSQCDDFFHTYSDYGPVDDGIWDLSSDIHMEQAQDFR